MLLAALERAGVTPASAERLHAFAYLADVLSPVWGLNPHEDVVFKTKEGPYFVDLQEQLDHLVILDLVHVENLGYKEIGKSITRVIGWYELQLASPCLTDLLGKLGARASGTPIDPLDRLLNEYLTNLASALSTVPDDEIALAATVDASYADSSRGFSQIIELRQRSRIGLAMLSTDTKANASVAVTERFEDFLPEGSAFSAAEKVYLYASYLGRKMVANG